MLPKAELLKELEITKKGCILVIIETYQELAKHPSEVKQLLHEFADVISQEMPPGLPPLRSIQCYIDFILGTVIPNKAAYRMNPKEHEEL